jgi:hypothetical protein
MKKLAAWLSSASLLLGSPAFADSTINNLSAGSALGGTEQIPMYQGSNPAVTTTPAAIKTYINPVTTGGCGISVSSNTASATVTQRNNTATSDTLLSTDCGTVVTESNASAVAVGIAQAGTTGFASGNYWTLKNKGAGLVTLTPTTSTIDGNATLTLKQNQSVDFYSDGTNYWTLPGRPTNVACADLTNSGTACQAATGTSGGTLPFLNGTNTWSGAQTFGEVLGTVTTQSGTTYTFAASDCGTEVTFSNSGAVTATIPQTLPAGCNIAVAQLGAGKVSVNGSAVAAATLHSAHSYTGTYAQYAVIGINIEANSGGSSAIALLTGDGS